MHKQGAINPATITWRRSHGRILCIEDRWRIRGEGLAFLELKSTCVLSVFDEDESLEIRAAAVAIDVSHAKFCTKRLCSSPNPRCTGVFAKCP
jgi:hypothetical protein